MKNKFKQIIILDKITISDNLINKLQDYSEAPLRVFNTDPKDQNDTIKRITEADCILLTWRTAIDREILAKCKNLKFICLSATNSNCIDLEECSKKNITVSNVKDYGDEGVVEWIVFELLNLARGFGKYQWLDHPAELSGKTMGIIGFGMVGKLLADIALGFNMKVLCYTRTRNSEYEKKGIIFVTKKELLQKSDIISLQTPKNLKILDQKDFDLMKSKILVNTTLGKAFAKQDFTNWIKKPNNYAIMDMVSDFHDEFKNLDRVIYADIVSGITKEAIARLNQKTLDNVSSYLDNKPINKL